MIDKISAGKNDICNNDVIDFINSEINERNLSNYFEKVNIADTGMMVNTNKATKKSVLNTNVIGTRKSIENRLIALPSFKKIYEKQIIFLRNKFITKLISLIHLFLTFHEIEHIEHIRTINQQNNFESRLLSDISTMLDKNPYFAATIGHDRLPDEVMADIEALRKINYLIESGIIKISNGERFLFNQFVAERLYSAYTAPNEFYSIDIGLHPAPMDFINYLGKTRLKIDNNFEFMNHVDKLDYNLDDIKYGKRIDSSVIDYLHSLRTGEVLTLNLEADIEKVMLESKQKDFGV